MRAEELILPLSSCSTRVQESWWADQPSYHQGQIQGFELAHPIIDLIYDLLELVKGPVLQIRSCRIFVTQGNNRISERRPCEDLVLIVQQKLEALNQTNDSLKQTFQIKMCGLKLILWDTL